MYRRILIYGIFFLFIISLINPVAFSIKEKNHEIIKTENTVSDGPPMDSPWPMYCYDTRHTGRSPFTAFEVNGVEKWSFKLPGVSYQSSPIIDSEGIIYVSRSDLYAINSNGTLKWMFDFPYSSYSVPCIDENGIIYFGTRYDYPNDFLYAIYSLNGSLKWKYGAENIISSPTVGNDGVIYFCDSDNWNIKALYPNGSCKWTFHTNNVIYSSPAIGQDNTVYCGSHDGNIYAIYGNNGTLRWKYNTGSWIHCSPSIADDGTVYCGSDDGYLYAFYPNNGTVKWKCNIGATWCSPSVDDNGVIYVGVFQEKFYAIYPNGTIKWVYDAPGRIWFGSSAAISKDRRIYFGTSWMDGGEGSFIVLNADDGSEIFKLTDGLYESSPAIGEDGTIYICSSHDDYGYLHAFGELDPDAPSAPELDGTQSGRPNREYHYTFKSISPPNRDVYYYIEWGDGTVNDWIGPYSSGQEITQSHKWTSPGIFKIKARAKDTDNLWGPWSEFEVSMPRNKKFNYRLFQSLLEHFSILQKIINHFTSSITTLP
jgi:outer membrane protein assembly factor BamB